MFQMIDLVALENGGQVVGYTNSHYGSPSNLIAPGRARVMSEGWETARKVSTVQHLYRDYPCNDPKVATIEECSTRFTKEYI